jgi:hypothetical protein
MLEFVDKQFYIKVVILSSLARTCEIAKTIVVLQSVNAFIEAHYIYSYW